MTMNYRLIISKYGWMELEGAREHCTELQTPEEISAQAPDT